MTKARKFMSGKYLNVEAVEAMGDSDRLVTIDHISAEYIQNQEKLVVYFKEHDSGLPLNNSRIEQLIELHGGKDDTEDWRGTKLRLVVDREVRYQGRKVGGVGFESIPDPPVKG